MSFYALSALINGLSSSALGIFVYLKNRKAAVNKTYGLTTIFIGIWSYSYFFWQIAISETGALFWCRALMAGAIFIPPTYLHFVLTLLGLHKEKTKVIISSYIFGFIFLVLNFTSLFVKSISPKLFFKYWPNAGITYLPFLFLYFLCVIYAITMMAKEQKQSGGIRRVQIRYVILGAFLGFGGGATNYPLWYDIPLPPIGNILVSVGIGVMAYAIVKYRLMDIKIALTRAGIFAFVYLFVLGIPFWIGYRYKLWMHSTWVMFVLATLGIFIYNHLRRQAENRLLAERLKRYDKLKRFTKTLGLVRDIGLERLTKLIVYRLVKTLEISYGAIYLYDKEEKSCLLKAGFTLKGPHPLLPKDIPQDNEFIKFILRYHKEFLLEDVQRLALEPKSNQKKPGLSGIDLSKIIFQMKDSKIQLVIPHFLEEQLIGFLVLGHQLSGIPYSESDLEVLRTLSLSAGLAILNSIFMIELRKTESELAEASRIAQIGYLASATGHQLSNVLNHIVQAGNFTLENLKENPQAIQELEKVISDIISTAQDGGLIVDEIRDYARKEKDKKFTLVNLKEVLDKTLHLLYIQVGKFQTIDIKINISEDVPSVLGSFVGLQNVFINIFNNCYDAILKMLSYIKEHPELGITDYKGRIEVNITREKGEIYIHIIDNGIGMTEDVKRRLFTPLYTTKASSEKRQEKKITGGTGIGLYTILLILKDRGGGIKVFSTEPLKGTDFLITLPVPKE